MKRKHFIVVKDEFLDFARRNEDVKKYFSEINEIANRGRVLGQNIVFQRLTMVQRLHLLNGTKQQLLLPCSKS